MAPRFIARQLSRPTGTLGTVIGYLMNRRNAKMNAFAMQQLQLTHSDRILEIGFGGGVNLAFLIQGAAFLAGVDRSRDVVARAKAKLSDNVKAGRADFREGRVEALPLRAVIVWKSLYCQHGLFLEFA